MWSTIGPTGIGRSVSWPRSLSMPWGGLPAISSVALAAGATAPPTGTVPWINYTFTTKESMTYTGKWVARQYGESPVGDTITIAYNADRPRRNKPAFIDWFKFK